MHNKGACQRVRSTSIASVLLVNTRRSRTIRLWY